MSQIITEVKTIVKEDQDNFKVQILWRNVFLMTSLHLGAIYGIKCVITECKFKTFYFMIMLEWGSAIGILCGSHRLWSHRSYKAKLPLQIILAFFQTMALQKHIYEWSREHRVHHKYSETNADPHNAKRGFFFSHIGWLLSKKHPDVKEYGQTVDMSDLWRNPIVRFQRKYYTPLVLLIWGAFPTLVPYYCWSETLINSICTCVFLRYAILLNVTWFVNSLAHMWGMKPYDKQISPVECIIRHIMKGEGFHNFHHAFPWDYHASEHGPLEVFNPATIVINFFAKIGWAYDLKRVPRLTIEKKALKCGDNTSRKTTVISSFNEQFFGFLSSFSYILIMLILKLSYKIIRNESINLLN